MKTFNIFMRIGFYKPELKSISIGGVQTYMYDLAKLAQRIGYVPVVYEMNNQGCDSEYIYDGIIIRQICRKPIWGSYFQACFDAIYKKDMSSDNLYIISTDQLSIRAKGRNAIAINHGVAFDEPIHKWYGLGIKMLKCLKNIQRAKNVERLVCVDYNFYNWFRTLDTILSEDDFVVIPNYIQGSISKEQFEIKMEQRPRNRILFARRWVEHRGVIIFADAVKRLLKEKKNVEVTFAGGGPYAEYLHEAFKEEKRVKFVQYQAKDSLKFHEKYDIAVIPTIFSEGTSLSLCEAMAAGCYCIATCVGGMTNILLDQFNGVLIKPTSNEIYLALKQALDKDEKAYRDICYNAYVSASCAFSKTAWENKWVKFLKNN